MTDDGVAETSVYVSAGSNIEPEKYLGQALRDMRQCFGPLSRSSVYRTTPVGFDGDDFLNLVVAFDTRLAAADVVAELDGIEIRAGRLRDPERRASRTLDLDLLLYGDSIVDGPGLRLPRSDILDYAFVLGPLAELAPDLVHPVERVTMQALWDSFDEDDQAIERLSPSPV